MCRLLSSEILTRATITPNVHRGTHHVRLLSTGICSGGHRGCGGQTSPSCQHGTSICAPEMPEKGCFSRDSSSSPAAWLHCGFFTNGLEKALSESSIWLKGPKPSKTVPTVNHSLVPAGSGQHETGVWGS